MWKPSTTLVNPLINRARTYSWVWANSAARMAQSVTDMDVGATGYQTDLARRYILLSTSPLRWCPLEDPRVAGFPPHFANVPCNGSAFSNVGLTITVTGPSARQSTNTNDSTILQRVAMVTTATLGAFRTTSGPGGGGIPSGRGVRWRQRTVIGVLTSSSRWCSGIMSDGGLGALVNVDYTTVTNNIFIGRPVGTESNLQIFHNDGSGTATVIDLGASFPATTAGQGYELELYTVDGTSWVYNVRNITSGLEVSGLISSNIPAATIQQCPIWAVNNNTDSTSATIDPVDVMFEQFAR